MLCTPGVSAEVVRTAPPLAFKGAVPRLAVPSVNTTVPVGTGPLLLTTVELNVMLVPMGTPVELAANAVVVAANCTISFTTLDCAAALTASPAYAAESAWIAAASCVVEKLATPLAFKFALPIALVPSKNVTVPIGVPVGAVAM